MKTLENLNQTATSNSDAVSCNSKNTIADVEVREADKNGIYCAAFIPYKPDLDGVLQMENTFEYK